MANPSALMTKLIEFKIEQCTQKALNKIAKYTSKEDFNVDSMKKKSSAAAQLTGWVLAVEHCAKVAPDAATPMVQTKQSHSNAALVQRDPKGSLNLNYTVVVEHCANCGSHGMHTRHDPAKYIHFG